MSLLCLSLAATLRCAGIPNIQSIVLIVPPAVEALLSLVLIRTVWRNGRKRWLLVVDAWLFLLLAILDHVSHATVRGMSSIQVFEPMDKAIGALSGIPILTYTSFLFLLTCSDILPLITPNTLRTVFQFGLFALIPPAIMTHELGSLLGVSYRVNTDTLVPETGFQTSSARSLSFAFTTSAVICLASFQLFIFLVCTWRISQAWDKPNEPVFVAATRPRSGSRSTGESYLGDEPGIRGLSWLALALALGATESLLSFGPQTFVLVLVRRILRVFSRASLMYALVRGSSDGFSNLEKGIKRSISNPRHSTFTRLTNPFADPSTPHSRVTVMYDLKSAPVLQMRFSGLDVDGQFRSRSGSASTSLAGHGGHSSRSIGRNRSRTISEKRAVPPLASIRVPDRAMLADVVATQSASSTMSSLPIATQSQTRLALASLNRSTSQLDRSVSSRTQLDRSVSSRTQLDRSVSSRTKSDEPVHDRTSLDGVRELTTQFPGVPRRRPTQLAYAVEEEDEPGHSGSSRSQSRHARTNTEDSNLSASSMARRKPVPAHTPNGTLIDLHANSSSGERVVLETHGPLFAQPRPYEYTSSRASSDETDTITTSSPAQILIGRPARLTERVAQLERQRLSSAEEHDWMRSSLPVSQTVVSRMPKVLDTADFASSRVELEGASPKSAWSAQAPWSRSRRSTLRPGANVEGWGRKLSDTDPSQVPPSLRPDELVRRSVIMSRHEGGSFVGDEPHAM
ncbi:unnamed protein product [Rhizoctonia solani]|uniref:Uncharacterized protein n=1 Tax=Rhizoctonia solani TaxID=456999 RepID=A0A8H3HRT5_9AGAM|nr:unnamed protein product [Rhizoctonia solani]